MNYRVHKSKVGSPRSCILIAEILELTSLEDQCCAQRHCASHNLTALRMGQSVHKMPKFLPKLMFKPKNLISLLPKLRNKVFCHHGDKIFTREEETSQGRKNPHIWAIKLQWNQLISLNQTILWRWTLLGFLQQGEWGGLSWVVDKLGGNLFEG